MRGADCLACGGACCEEVELPWSDLRLPVPDAEFWLQLHGTPGTSPNSLRLEVKCRELTDQGTCAVYAERSVCCMVYEAGGVDCQEVLHRRRTPEQIKRILGT